MIHDDVYQDLCLIFGVLIQDHGLDLWLLRTLVLLPFFGSCTYIQRYQAFLDGRGSKIDSRGVVYAFLICIPHPFPLFLRQLGFGFSVAHSACF